MMDTSEHKCKSCGIIFDTAGQEIDKCMKKRLYCELCMAQKNPLSKTEQKIKKRYFLITFIAAFMVLLLQILTHWGKSKNDNVFEYLIGFGIGFLIIWAITALVLLPILLLMKKPHKTVIKKEKEKYVEEIEEKKKLRSESVPKK